MRDDYKTLNLPSALQLLSYTKYTTQIFKKKKAVYIRAKQDNKKIDRD